MPKRFLVPGLGLIKVVLQDEKAIRKGKALSSRPFWCVVGWKITWAP